MDTNEVKKHYGKKCPYCGNRQTAKILYGMPSYSEDLKRQIESGELKLGGCCLDAVRVNGKLVELVPSYYCNKCEKEFGSPPLIKSNKESVYEDYRDFVSSVEMSVWGYPSDKNTSVKISKNDDGALVEVFSTRLILPFPEDVQISTKDWKRILDKLYSKIYLHEWVEEYIDYTILDGTEWDLKIVFDGNRSKIYHGCNAYPPYWRELKSIFSKYARF